METEKITKNNTLSKRNNLVADFEKVCYYYKDGKSVMYALSFHCVDRTFLLISRDPACIKVGNMPFLLVVQYCDREPTCLSCGFNTLGRLPASTDFYHFHRRFLNNLLWQVVFLEDKMIHILVLLLAVVTGVASYYLMKKSAAFFTTLKKKLQQKVNPTILSNVLGVIT